MSCCSEADIYNLTPLPSYHVPDRHPYDVWQTLWLWQQQTRDSCALWTFGMCLDLTEAWRYAVLRLQWTYRIVQSIDVQHDSFGPLVVGAQEEMGFAPAGGSSCLGLLSLFFTSWLQNLIDLWGQQFGLPRWGAPSVTKGTCTDELLARLWSFCQKIPKCIFNSAKGFPTYSFELY